MLEVGDVIIEHVDMIVELAAFGLDLILVGFGVGSGADALLEMDILLLEIPDFEGLLSILLPCFPQVVPDFLIVFLVGVIFIFLMFRVEIIG